MALAIKINQMTPEMERFLEGEIDLVREIIKANTRSKFSGIKDVVGDIIDLNGKLLRPLFAIVAAQFGTYQSDKITKLAASVEVLHMATLIHDDIIDDSKLRRNRESVQSKYGKDMAVYAGDYLLSKAMSMLNADDYDADHMKKLARAIEMICESELLQYHSKFKSMTVKNYLRVISGKTAALFAVSMFSGASESECPEPLSKTLGKIGYELGMAFQIIDDILDFSEQVDVVGKTLRNDLKKGYYTLPVIYAIQKEKLVDGELSEPALMLLIEKNKGIEQAKALAKKYTDRANKRIKNLPECESKEVVKGLSELLLNRKY